MKKIVWTNTLFFGGVMGIAVLLRLALLPSPSGDGAGELLIAGLVYGFICLLFFQVQKKKKQAIWVLMTFVVALKVSIVLANGSISLFPPTQDALKNISSAAELVRSWETGQLVLDTSQSVELAYVVPLAGLFWLFGYNLFLGSMITLLFSMAGVYFIYKTAVLFLSEKEALLAALIWALMPYLTFMSFFYNREMVVISLMIFLGYQSLVFINELRPMALVLFFLAWVYLAFLREESALIMLLFACAVVLFGRVAETWHRFSTGVKACIASILLVISGGIGFSFIKSRMFIQLFYLSGYTPQSFYDRAARHLDFGFGYLTAFGPESWVECLFQYAPVQAFNFLVRPLPWEMFRMNQAFLIFNNLILYFLYGMAVLGLLKCLYAAYLKYSLAMIFFLVISIIPAGLVQGNGFAAARHREQFLFYIYILGSAGIFLVIKVIRSVLLKQGVQTYDSVSI